MRNLSFAGVAFGNGKFVGVGEGLTILTSTDGTNWVCRSDRITNPALNINFATETYICGGDAVTLTFNDAPLPTETIVPFRPWSVGFGGGRFLIVCDSGWILTSTDGEAWKVCPTVTPNRLLGVTFGAGNYVAVGEAGTILGSPDGVRWVPRKPPTASTLHAVAYGDGVFVAVGDGGAILTSTDGAEWTRRPPEWSTTLGCVAHGNGMFLAAAVDGGLLALMSKDGFVWRELEHPGPRLIGLSYANGLFFGTGEAGLLTTLRADRHWGNTLAGPPSERRVRTVTCGNDLYLAAGSGIHVSRDARSWCWQGLRGSKLLQGYFIGRGLAVLAGPDGVLDSKDGVTWTKQDGRAIRGDVNGNVLRTFRTTQRTNVIVLASDDGVEWRRLSPVAKDAPRTIPAAVTVPAVASTPVAAAEPPATTIRLNGEKFALNLPARPGEAYRLQASTNLEHWVDLTVLTNTGGMLLYTDRDATNFPMRFYRLLRW